MSSVARSACSSDLIPIGQKVAYNAEMLVNNLQAAAMPAMMVVLNLGIGLDPRLVGIIGFITPQPGSTEMVVQGGQTLFYLRVFDVFIPIITSTIALMIMSTYEITEDRARETRQLLEHRRGHVS